MENKALLYFNGLVEDGSSCYMRFLHTKPSTVETATVHKIKVKQPDGTEKTKYHKCLETGCPFCAIENCYALQRGYFHIIDYTDNQEKLWSRTPRLLKELEVLAQEYENLHEVVVKVTRVGDDNRADYKITVANQKNFPDTFEKELIDKPLAQFQYMKRNQDECIAFIRDGVFPERKAFVSKEEYKKQKAAEQANAQKPTTPAPTKEDIEDSLPF